ncbi:HflK protein [Methylophaga frappieri]|jgi:membrane protease subunit HflK|uniref:Protein HflK n=1 Tax=Methylophaga frappieri (strain ATCC BAA-2434 / DSM 25690 / JAM7) TaxID=754477 RepID=I1YKW6_METFJ|nr:FtsH protease activity modulator HflK [Methylophaga frappieri]AFJ03559.1 HflK protein [Methylophaga frappieri]
MAWNEPGNGDKDPWGKRGGNNEGPPDLDEVIRNFQQKLGGVFGGKRNGNAPNPADSNGGGSLGVGLIVAILFVVWLLSGIYIVEPAERGVVLRFGQYHTTAMPGPHWHFPYPIDHVEVINVENIRTVEIGYRSSGARPEGSILSEALMLTNDENIVDLKIAGQYRVKDAAQYLFNVRTPDSILRQMMESAVREVVGQSNMDFVLTEGRSEVATRTEQILQEMLDDHGTGLSVTSVSMQDVQPPEQVQAAFADVVKAREDEVRQKNEAEAYANDIIPRARGQAFRIIQEAEAYKSQVVAKANGDTSRFLQVMTEYDKAPLITEERLYLDAMESVYSRTNKVMVDVDSNGNNVLYLPLDRMGKRSPNPLQTNNSPARIDLDSINYPSGQTNNASTDARSRGGR